MKLRALVVALLLTVTASVSTPVQATVGLPPGIFITDVPAVVVDPGPVAEQIVSEHYTRVYNSLWFTHLHERPSRWEALMGPADPYTIKPRLVRSSATSEEELVEQLAQANLRPATIRELIAVGDLLRDRRTSDTGAVAELRASLTYRENFANGYFTRLYLYTPDARMPLEPSHHGQFGRRLAEAMVSIRYSDRAHVIDGREVYRRSGSQYELEFSDFGSRNPSKFGEGVYTVAVPN